MEFFSLRFFDWRLAPTVTFLRHIARFDKHPPVQPGGYASFPMFPAPLPHSKQVPIKNPQ
jgi:hypothetical protein